MQMYTNQFTIAMNSDGTEVMINFAQSVPQVPGGAKTGAASEMPTEHIPVSTLVMTGQCAQNLLNALQEVFNKYNTNKCEK